MVQLPPEFSQVCIWEGTLVGENKRQEFVEFMMNEFGCRVIYLEELVTPQDTHNGYPVEGTGGRNDVLFAVHSDDIPKFAVKRLLYGIRWLDDIYSNGNGRLYPERIKQYQSWYDETEEQD